MRLQKIVGTEMRGVLSQFKLWMGSIGVEVYLATSRHVSY